MIRKLDDWLDTFIEWVYMRTEAPDNYIVWGGICTLAAAIRRQVVIPDKGILGGWKCYPHLYVLFVGPPGFRKTTAVRFGSELLEKIPSIIPAPTIVSQAAIQSTLVGTKDHAIYIINEEFGDLVMKSGKDMMDWLTSMYDGKAHLTSSTILRGTEIAIKPCVNLFAATTPDWIAENMPAYVIGGGFARRVIFVYEDVITRRSMYYPDEEHAWEGKQGINYKEVARVGGLLLEDLEHISNIHGDFSIPRDVMMWMDNWYQNNCDPKGIDKRLRGYYQTKPTFIHKVAMLLHLSRSDELVLELEDFERAIKLIEILEKNLPKALKGVGAASTTPTLETLMDYVIKNKKATTRELQQQFYYAQQPKLLEELIYALEAIGFVIREADGRSLIPTPMGLAKFGASYEQ